MPVAVGGSVPNFILYPNLTAADAWAAIHSPLPVDPIFSVVVALTLTLSELISIWASDICIALRCGVFGFSQMIVTSTLLIIPPRFETMSGA